MIWTIIGIIILAAFIGIYQSGKDKVAENKAKEAEDKANYKQAKRYYDQPEAFEKGVLLRLQGLGVDTSKVEKIKYYHNYFDKQDTNKYTMAFMWPTEGAIAFCYADVNIYDTIKGSHVPALTIPPSQVNPLYHELKDIKGLYRRSNLTIIQIKDTNYGYPIEEYEKIKKIYEEAKAMTTTFE